MMSSEPVNVERQPRHDFPTSVILEGQPVERKASRSTNSLPDTEKQPVMDSEESDVAVGTGKHRDPEESASEKRHGFTSYQRFRPFLLGGSAALILAWWISSTVMKATRHRWIVQTILAWFFLLIIAFRFIPNSAVTRPFNAFWKPFVSKPLSALPRWVKFTVGWLSLLAIVLGSAFGFPLTGNTEIGDRAISVLGLLVFQFSFWATSRNRSIIPWHTTIVGLFIQQVVALFVLKSGAGFSIFKWISTLAADFINQGLIGATFFFDADTIAKHWFFVNILASIIFFIAFVQMMYYLGVMQWILKGFAVVFFKLLDVSGAEAVVAAASPWVGMGESACLVRPYVDLMTESELHLTMTSGFSTIAGSVLAAYIGLGVPPENLVTSSVMSIPASIAISKMRIPEQEEPLTRGAVVIDRGKKAESNKPVNALQAFSQGAVFGVVVAGQILANVLTILSLVGAINGLLTWIGRGFGIHHLTLQLILRYIGYPITFLLGVPRAEILRVSELLATKLIANEFAAYVELKAIQSGPNPLTPRAYTIATYALCGFANLGSLGIQIGVLGALAPSRSKIIARIATSAMICGFISTLQTAGIAGMLV